MSNKPTQKSVLTVPKGYDIEDVFDTDDGDFNEPPILSEEVEINFERDNERKESSV